MSKYIVLLGSLYVQMLALASLWLIRSTTMVQQRRSGPRLLLNPLALDHDVNDPAAQNKKVWKRGLQLLFGRALWSPEFK